MMSENGARQSDLFLFPALAVSCTAEQSRAAARFLSCHKRCDDVALQD